MPMIPFIRIAKSTPKKVDNKINDEDIFNIKKASPFSVIPRKLNIKRLPLSLKSILRVVIILTHTASTIRIKENRTPPFISIDNTLARLEKRLSDKTGLSP